MATFYEAAGKIVEFETAGTSPSEIPARQSSDFMVDAVIGERVSGQHKPRVERR